MLYCLRDARPTLERSLRLLASSPPQPINLQHARHSSKKGASKKASTPIQKSLLKDLESDEYRKHSSNRRKKGSLRILERTRVNIVSEDLCGTIVDYIKPSLDRHKGCDLIDLNPGVGVWSRTLHDYLQPRKHVLMEADVQRYEPYLASLLSKPNVTLIPNTGVLWSSLYAMMDEHLSHHPIVPRGPDVEPPKNDTLLVTLNITANPPRRHNGFESMSTMFLYQFLTSMRYGTLFQRYGRVRMLIWVNDDEKRRVLPRCAHRRHISAFKTELSVEYMHEVAGAGESADKATELRDEWLNLESAINVVKRMRDAGLEMPAGRETRMYLEASKKSNMALLGEKLASVRPLELRRPFRKEFARLQEEGGEHLYGLGSPGRKRYKELELRQRSADREWKFATELIAELDELKQIAHEGSPSRAEELARRTQEWTDAIENMGKNAHNEFLMHKDQYYLYRQSPPALLWDRRAYEPLLTDNAKDFFPHSPTALLDVQPKALHPLLRSTGPDSTRSGDLSDVLLREWFEDSKQPASEGLRKLWPGFDPSREAVPSLWDLKKGGSAVPGLGEISARGVNQEQWLEILQAWMDWPFRPSYLQTVGSLNKEDEEEEDAE